MDYPVYKLFFARRGLKAAALSAEEFQAVIARNRPIAERFGVRQMIVADTRWSNDQYSFFGVELFNSLEVMQDYTRALEEIDWFGYMESESYLGIPMDGTANNITPPEPPRAGERSVYRVYLSHLTDYGAGLPAEELNETWAMGREALHRAGGRMLLNGYARWNNEEWESFGVERFPNQEAVLAYSQFLSASGWYRVARARSCLGLSMGGEIAPAQI